MCLMGVGGGCGWGQMYNYKSQNMLEYNEKRNVKIYNDYNNPLSSDVLNG